MTTRLTHIPADSRTTYYFLESGFKTPSINVAEESLDKSLHNNDETVSVEIPQFKDVSVDNKYSVILKLLHKLSKFMDSQHSEVDPNVMNAMRMLRDKLEAERAEIVKAFNQKYVEATPGVTGHADLPTYGDALNHEHPSFKPMKKRPTTPSFMKNSDNDEVKKATITKPTFDLADKDPVKPAVTLYKDVRLEVITQGRDVYFKDVDKDMFVMVLLDVNKDAVSYNMFSEVRWDRHPQEYCDVVVSKVTNYIRNELGITGRIRLHVDAKSMTAIHESIPYFNVSVIDSCIDTL